MAAKFKKNQLLVIPSSNEKIEKFTNYIMLNGKKLLARKIFEEAMKDIKKAGHPNPLIVWEWAIEKASPDVMVKSKRIWWAIYQVPIEVPNRKKFFYSCKWLLAAAKSKKWKNMSIKLSEELLAAYAGQWAAVKKKEEVHKMAEANKAFAYLAKYVK